MFTPSYHRPSDLWTMRIVVLNGHAIYSAWLLVASSLNLSMWLKKRLPLSNEGWATSVPLIVLTVGIIAYWILENFVFPSSMAYTWSPWLAWFVALIGILVKHWKLLVERGINQLFVLAVTLICIVLFIIRITLFLERYDRHEIPTGSYPAGI